MMSCQDNGCIISSIRKCLLNKCNNPIYGASLNVCRLDPIKKSCAKSVSIEKYKCKTDAAMGENFLVSVVIVDVY